MPLGEVNRLSWLPARSCHLPGRRLIPGIHQTHQLWKLYEIVPRFGRTLSCSHHQYGER